MPPKRGPKSTSRKNTPVSPPKAAIDSPKAPRRSTRGVSRDDDATHEGQRVSVEINLPSVRETDEDAIAVGGETADIEGSATDSDESDHSSVTQGELDSLDYDFIVDSLVDLHREALKIIQFFGTHTPDSLPALALDLANGESKASQRFRYQFEKLSKTLERFDTGKRVYIIPETIVRKVRGEGWADIQDGKWRPDAIVYLANLAQLLAASFLGGEDRLEMYFDSLFKYYPRVFASPSPGSRFVTTDPEQAIEFSNEFRTQFFIHIARRDHRTPNYDPGDVLRELFLDSEGQFRGMEASLTAAPTAPEKRLEAVNQFITTSSKTPVKLDQLTKAFPWSGYLDKVVQWVNVRTFELEAQIVAQGGINHIVHCIEDGDFSPLEYQQVQPEILDDVPIDPQLTANTASSSKKRATRRLAGAALEQQIAQLKSMQYKAAEASGIAQATERLAEGVSVDQGPPPPDGTDVAPTQQTQFIEEQLAAQVRESNKENIESAVPRQRSFLDKQSNARKIPFHETNPGKRLRDEQENSEDDEFEQDQRPTKQVRAGRPRSNNAPAVDLSRPIASTQSMPPPPPPLSPTNRHPSSSAPPGPQPPAEIDDGDLARSSQWAEANAAAKMAVKINRERVADVKVQNRKPWTHEEVNRLMELIELNGPAYSKILQDDKNPELYPEGSVLLNRSQVQLKDKARNVKLDFIKGRKMLPPGFSQVSIGKRHVEILQRSFGIDYIDGDGRGANLGVGEE